MRFRNLKKILAATMVTTMVLGNYGTAMALDDTIFSEDDVPGNNTSNSTSDEENYWDSYEHEIQNHFVYDVCEKIWEDTVRYSDEEDWGIKKYSEDISIRVPIHLESSNFVTIYEQKPGDIKRTPNSEMIDQILSTDYEISLPETISDEEYEAGDFSDWDRGWYDKWVEVQTGPDVTVKINHLADHDDAWDILNGNISWYKPYLRGINQNFASYSDEYTDYLEKMEKTLSIRGFQCLMKTERNCVEVGAATGKYLAVLYDKTGNAIGSRVIQTDGTPSCTFSGLKPGKYTVKWQSEHYSQTYTKVILKKI